ncbi:MAG: radical SAM protein [Elusimicrobia bacterium]|nr:radical SAM protein [Elusimicrobiota bacterium]
MHNNKYLKSVTIEVDLETLDIGLHQVKGFLNKKLNCILEKLKNKEIVLGRSFSIPENRIIGRIIDTYPLLEKDKYGVCDIKGAKIKKFRVVGCGYISIYIYFEFKIPKENVRAEKFLKLGPNDLFVKRTPSFIVWTISNRCNLYCQHCYYFPKPNIGIPHLSLKDCRKVIDEIANTGVNIVSLSGGEPLMIKDIKKVITYTKSKGLKMIFNSNLCLMEKETAEFLKKMDIDLVITSLESADGNIHDKLRGEGSFHKTIRGIKYCVEAGLNIGINTAVTKLNYRGLKDIVEFGEELGVSFFKFEALIPRGRAVKNFNSLSPLAKEYIKIANDIDGICEKYFDRIPIIISNVFERLIENKINFCCPSGQLFYTITHNGNIAICPSLTHIDYKQGNLIKSSFRKYLMEKSFREKEQYDKYCLKCRYFEICKSGCFSRSYFKNGNVSSRDPLCEMFENEFGIT